MKHISILVPLGHSSLPNIDGTHQIFTEANKFAAALGKSPFFTVQLVGLSKVVQSPPAKPVLSPGLETPKGAHSKFHPSSK